MIHSMASMTITLETESHMCHADNRDGQTAIGRTAQQLIAES